MSIEERLRAGAEKNKNRPMTEYQKDKVRCLILSLTDEEFEVAKAAAREREYGRE